MGGDLEEGCEECCWEAGRRSGGGKEVGRGEVHNNYIRCLHLNSKC